MSKEWAMNMESAPMMTTLQYLALLHQVYTNDARRGSENPNRSVNARSFPKHESRKGLFRKQNGAAARQPSDFGKPRLDGKCMPGKA